VYGFNHSATGGGMKYIFDKGSPRIARIARSKTILI
jgi:hypothetical protein